MSQRTPGRVLQRMLTGQGRESTAVFIVTAVAGAAALLRDAVVGRTLGIGLDLDAWTLALALTGFTTTSIITATGSTVVPAVRRASATGGDQLEAEASAALVSSLLIALAVSVALLLTSAALADLVLGSNELVDITAPPLRILAVTAVPGLIVAGACGAISHALGRFTLPALLPLLPALVVTVSVAIGLDRVGVLSAIHGAAIMAGTTVLAGSVFSRAQLSMRQLRRHWRTRRHLKAEVGYAWIGAVAFSVNPIIDLTVAANLTDGGAGRLGLASRLTIATGAVLAAALAVPGFPRLTAALDELGPRGLRRQLRTLAGAAVLAGAGLTLVIAASSLPLASLVFSDSGVSPAEARSIGLVQMTYSLTAAPYVLAAVALRGIYVVGRHRAGMIVALVGCGLNVVADVSLGRWLGLHGIALATFAVYLLTSTAMIAVVRVATSDSSATAETGRR
jgi:putative peptidoglycan lipid II flippase